MEDIGIKSETRESSNYNGVNAESTDSGKKLENNAPSELQPIESSWEKTENKEEMQEFAKTFKQRREKLSLTLEAVAISMSKMYRVELTKQYVSRFETCKLSFKNMCRMKPFAQRWLKDVEVLRSTPHSSKTHRNNTLESIVRQKKLRTTIDSTLRQALEQAFIQNPKPSTAELSNLAKTLDMEIRVLRMWFSNRRHKAKHTNGAAESCLSSAKLVKTETTSVSSALSSPSTQHGVTPSSMGV